MQKLIDKLGLGDGVVSMAVFVGLGLLLLLVVIVLAGWLIRAMRPSLNIGGGQARGSRPQRLAITDAFNLDREGRRLVIIRRDNVEHLILIGGPNDVVVEKNIMRGERASRGARGDAAEQAAQIEAGMPQETQRPAPDRPQMPTIAPTALAPAAPQMPPAMISPPRPAQSVAPSSVSQVSEPPQAAPPKAQHAPASHPRAPGKIDDDFERALAAMEATQRMQQPGRVPPAAAAPPRPQPVAPGAPQRPNVPVSREPAPAAPVPSAPAPSYSAPQRSYPPSALDNIPSFGATPPSPPPAKPEPMSEMARRLNEVLQKPLSNTPRASFSPGGASLSSGLARPGMSAPKIPEPASQAPPPPPAPSATPSAAKDSLGSGDIDMDLLEEEMARLLGRPQTTTKSSQS